MIVEEVYVNFDSLFLRTTTSFISSTTIANLFKINNNALHGIHKYMNKLGMITQHHSYISSYKLLRYLLHLLRGGNVGVV